MTGRQLREAREKMGLSQTQLGDLIGYKTTQMSRMENGWAKVPKVVGVAVSGLLAKHNAPPNPSEDALRALKRVMSEI